MSTLIQKLLALSRINPFDIVLLALLGIFCGALNAGMVTVVAETLKAKSFDNLTGGALFAGAFVLFMLVQRFSLRRISILTAAATATIRQQILVAAHDAALVQNERLDPHVVRTLLLRDAATLSSALPNMTGILGSLATVLFGLAYLFWLSAPAATIVCAVIVVAAGGYHLMFRNTMVQMRQAYDEADRSYAFADDLLRGYKELKLDARWAEEFMRDDVLKSTGSAGRLLGALVARQQDIGLVGVGAFYLLMGAMTFVVLSWLKLDSAVMISTVMVLLFLQAHIQGVVLRLPGLNDALFSARRIDNMLAETRLHSEIALMSTGATLPDAWREIRLANVGYRYGEAGDNAYFNLRHIDLSIPRGATIFLVGANGSGKTTLAKILLGLYRPSEGSILVDQTEITERHVLGYRAMFNAVFSDAYLFRRSMRGQLRQAEGRLNAILADMKITLTLTPDQRIDVKPFSQGQKKRLASALSAINDKQVCLFDEWTADQDPEFRHYFYHSYLPLLKAAGKTLLVITHDDRYFHMADMVVKLDGGKIVAIDRHEQAAQAVA